MKKTCANLLLLVFLAGLGLIACDLVATPESAATATAQPTATASPTVTPTRTPTATSAPASETPTATPQPPSSPPPPTSGAPATPTALALPGPAIVYNGISFNVGPDLGNTVYARDEQMYGAEVYYTRFTFAPDDLCQFGCVEVYPVRAYQAAFPDWPLPPLGAATLLRAQDQTLDFQNGSGARSVRMRGQNVFFAHNEALVYDFQGYTDDGQYYVSIMIPLDAPILLSAADPNANENAAAIPVPTGLPGDNAQLGDAMQAYNQEAERQLDQLAATDFTPSLEVLDALVASLAITRSPDEDTPPPVTETRGPFRLVAGLPAEWTGDVIALRVYSPRSEAEGEAADGRLWAATTNSYAVWQAGRWQSTPTDLQIQNMLPAPDGTVWLAGPRDVFIVDGARWTILTPADMTMTAPFDPDLFTSYVLEQVGEQVWVGRCDWRAPGPLGGGGARWTDGTSWRGADSPVAAGCVTAIRADAQGRVWVAANADLWRYDPAAEVWDYFAPPEPPPDQSFGLISDLAFDPAGQPWPLYVVCGGGSCGQMELRYQLEDGAWVLVREEIISQQRLVFDETGAPWLFFLSGAVYRFQVDPSPDTLVADFVVHAVTTDAEGRIWAVGGSPLGETAVWLLEEASK